MLVVDELFSGIDRVVALVSRVEGTYEFEVQPLREYFAARYLYDTAPYSPPGNERRGTKPDRFDAIARNFYWLNVTRFFAGCFSKGELPGLRERAEELLRTDYEDCYHPRALMAMLLADWVFAQNPRVTSEIVDLVTDRLGLTYLARSGRAMSPNRVAFEFPAPDCGRDAVVDRCMKLLVAHPASDFAGMLTSIVRSNTSIAERIELWLAHTRDNVTEGLGRWFAYAQWLGILAEIPLAVISELLPADTSFEPSVATALIESGRFDLWEYSAEGQRRLLDLILDRGICTWRTSSASYLSLATNSLNVPLLNFAFDLSGEGKLSDIGGVLDDDDGMEWFLSDEETLQRFRDPETELEKECLRLALIARGEFRRPSVEWTTQLDPWNRIVECGRDLWGERWLFYLISYCATRVTIQNDQPDVCEDFFDKDKSLCERAMYARFQRDSSSWWLEQFTKVHDRLDLPFFCLCAVGWVSLDVLVAIAPLLNSAIASFSKDEWSLFSSAFYVILFSAQEEFVTFDLDILPAELHERTVVALSVRAKQELRNQLFGRYLENYKGSDPVICAFWCQTVITVLGEKKAAWEGHLGRIRSLYRPGDSEQDMRALRTPSASTVQIPIDVAKEIIEHADQYPSYLVDSAEKICRLYLSENLVPVGRIAEAERWFDT
jgi:hypothetical protein